MGIAATWRAQPSASRFAFKATGVALALDALAMWTASTAKLHRCPDGWTDFNSVYVWNVLLVVPASMVAIGTAVNMLWAEPEHRRRALSLIALVVVTAVAVLVTDWHVIRNAPGLRCMD